jgi:uncharacterized protein YceH (UPF0502 family)
VHQQQPTAIAGFRWFERFSVDYSKRHGKQPTYAPPMADGSDPMSPRMDPVEARVVGSLAEKELTTPQQYPLSLNALVLACNQTSNRDPVVDYDEYLVEVALSSLKAGGWVRFVHPSHGRSVIRYRHVLDEKLGLDERRLALLAVLLLRGPQTSGELRARTERMAQFESIGSIESDLERLAAELEPLVVRLPRRPGQKEERWAQLLTGEPVMEPVPREGSPAREGSSTSLADMRAEVAALREEVSVLRGELAELRSALE